MDKHVNWFRQFWASHNDFLRIWKYKHKCPQYNCYVDSVVPASNCQYFMLQTQSCIACKVKKACCLLKAAYVYLLWMTFV